MTAAPLPSLLPPLDSLLTTPPLVSPPCLSFLGGGGDGEAEHGPHGRDGEEEGERGDGATGEEEEEEGAPAESNRAAAAKFFLLKPTGRFTFLPLLPIAIVECKFSREEKFSIRFTIFLHVELGMKMVRIFSDRIRDRIRLERLRSVRIESECLISDIVSVSEYLNHIFMMSTSNRILSNIVDIIHIRIRIRPKI